MGFLALFARGADAAETIQILKELGISDEIIEAARKQKASKG
jgi:hypothetical protein